MNIVWFFKILNFRKIFQKLFESRKDFILKKVIFFQATEQKNVYKHYRKNTNGDWSLFSESVSIFAEIYSNSKFIVNL